MDWLTRLLSAALIGGTVLAQEPAPTPAQRNLEERKLRLREANERLVAAQDQIGAAESALSDAERGVVQELVEAARGGDEGALRQVLGKLGGGSTVDYHWAAPFKGPGVDAAKVVRVIREEFKNPDPSYRSKFCWLLGQNGSETAAGALRDVLATEKDVDVLGVAITELAK